MFYKLFYMEWLNVNIIFFYKKYCVNVNVFFEKEIDDVVKY